MKLRSGERREEQVGGGRIAEGAVEGRMARASPVAVAVAGAKTAPCDRASVSVPIPGGWRSGTQTPPTPVGTWDFFAVLLWAGDCWAESF
jgi:hypothetical protein